jgi:hypothetical protein
MLNTVKSLGYTFFNSLPSIRFDTPANTIKKATMVAMPIITLLGMQSIQRVEAGPWVFCLCIASCTGLLEAPPLYGACLVACGATLPGPLP